MSSSSDTCYPAFPVEPKVASGAKPLKNVSGASNFFLNSILHCLYTSYLCPIRQTPPLEVPCIALFPISFFVILKAVPRGTYSCKSIQTYLSHCPGTYSRISHVFKNYNQSMNTTFPLRRVFIGCLKERLPRN